ncbi:hypothetical protein ACWGTI_02915 [Mesorhizobium sp. ArgA1]
MKPRFADGIVGLRKQVLDAAFVSQPSADPQGRAEKARDAFAIAIASKSKGLSGFNMSVERLAALGLLSGLAWLDTGV